jgi:hypothetical protein
VARCPIATLEGGGEARRAEALSSVSTAVGGRVLWRCAKAV